MPRNIFMLLGLVTAFLFVQFGTHGQCTEFGSPRVYKSTASTTVSTSASNWQTGSGNFSQGQIAKFSDGRSYNFSVTNTFDTGGIILAGNSTLSMDKSSQGNTAAFSISNGCIVVGAGSTLNLVYFNSMTNVTVCVEDGGTINFDSRSSSQDRDKFTFEGVQINLQGPNAKLNFGTADIDVLGTSGISISGWTGTAVCNNGTAPSGYSSGNISWTTATQDICEIISARILPIEFISFTAAFNSSNRSGKLNWTTAKEWENSHFEIERAINSVKSWDKVGEVNGQGYSEAPVDYSFEDLNLPLAGGTIFYRHKQVDFDGDVSYSVTRAIQVQGIESTNLWALYPNPSSQNSTLKLELLRPDLYQDETISISLVSQMGAVKSLQVESPEAINSLIAEWMTGASPGMYIIQIRWGAYSQQLKLLRK